MLGFLLMKRASLLLPLSLALALAIILSNCATVSQQSLVWQAKMGIVPDSKVTHGQLHQELKVKRDFIPRGRYGRRLRRPMKAQYITIHSTQNYSGDAYAHAKALKRGALRGGVCGYLCWHFTVQENVVIQHLPTDEQGEHADFDGPGNRTSIGIEMAEHRGNNMPQTIDRTAKLTASLMYTHGIPLSHVVPHYHWPRKGYSTPNKNCPHFLMDDGKPRGTWRWFLSRVKSHYDRIVAQG
ncbi:MAG: N-acetylmuramoyl-L-alanine amidase [Verrucomicrobiales bacterium]|jgi:N-acetylmuramoyl-L-alanine amidase